MERQFYKELWGLRFQKMLALEKKSVDHYEDLLRECKAKYKEHSIQPHIERLIKDEKKHIVLVQELIDILNSQA